METVLGSVRRNPASWVLVAGTLGAALGVTATALVAVALGHVASRNAHLVPQRGAAPKRRFVVGVIGGRAPNNMVTLLAESLGRWLATQAVHLLTGGGGGVMEATSKAFCSVESRLGLVIGVLPGVPAGADWTMVRQGTEQFPAGLNEDYDVPRYMVPPAGYPNPWVEIAVRTHLPLQGERGTELASRNHVNIHTSDLLVALPGAAGMWYLMSAPSISHAVCPSISHAVLLASPTLCS
jgi:predicted Rossmann-fold nucleotide-binding protein